MKDQTGRQITINIIPKRIVSLVPSQTELLFDLDLENTIVGITKFCVHPSHLINTKQVVGGTKQINIEKIRALKPDIILCNKEENTKAIVEACQGICTVHVSNIITIEDCTDLITQYGKLFNKTENAKKINHKINYNLKAFKNYIKNKPILKVAYFIWKDPWMVAANGTYINHLLELNKLDNIYTNKVRYPVVNIKTIKEDGNPQVVMLSSEPYPFKNEHASAIIKVSNHVKPILVDGEYFSWYGSRLIKAFDYFKILRSRL